MPPPVVRQEELWAWRAAREKVDAQEREVAGQELRRQCLARMKEERERQVKLQEEDRKRWRVAQQARRKAEKMERAQSARGRRTGVAAIEKARQAFREENEEREQSAHDEGKKLLYSLRQRDWADWEVSQARKAAGRSFNPFCNWQEEAAEAARIEGRKKIEREAANKVMREQEQIAQERIVKAEAESRRRAQAELSRQQQRQQARVALRAKLKAKEAEAGWEANLHYLNTHGDRLHWETPVFKHTLEEDGDGRWPFPMLPPKEPLRTFQVLRMASSLDA